MATPKGPRTLPPQYQCSKCKFIQAKRSWNPFDSRIPVTPSRSLRKLKLLTHCPDEGPETCELIDPEDGLGRKWRTIIENRGTSIRLCTPFIVTRRGLDCEKKTAEGGPALIDTELWREFLLEERIRTGDRPKSLDIADATRAFGRFPRILQMDKVWCVVPELRRHWDEWTPKAYELGFTDPLAEELRLKIVNALNPAFSRKPDEERRAVLFVPIDLRGGIEEQLSKHAIDLGQVRDWLYRLGTERAPARPKAHSVWRDTYVYLLANCRKRNVAQIASQVFPGKPRLARERLVRQILARVEKALAKSGDDQIAPPVK